MWSQVIVGPAPVGIEHPGFQDAVEYLPGEEFIAGSAVEAFDVEVLPGRTGLDVAGRGASLAASVANRSGHEHRAVVAADLLREAA